VPALTFFVAEFPAKGRVSGKISQMTAEGFCVAFENLFVLSNAARQFHDVTVCLELSERGLQNASCPHHPKPRNQVDRHVVGGGKARF